MREGRIAGEFDARTAKAEDIVAKAAGIVESSPSPLRGRRLGGEGL
jgi:hypothetical protein